MLPLYILFEGPFITNSNSARKLASRTKLAMTQLKQNPNFSKLIGHYKNISGYDKNKLGMNLRNIIKSHKMRFFQSKIEN